MAIDDDDLGTKELRVAKEMAKRRRQRMAMHLLAFAAATCADLDMDGVPPVPMADDEESE